MLEAEVPLGEVKSYWVNKLEGEVLLGEEVYEAEVQLGEREGEVPLGEQEAEVQPGEH